MTDRPPRSWLFVPADSEKKIAKAIDSEADALIFDLEDSVAPGARPPRATSSRNSPRVDGGPQWWVRVNPIGSDVSQGRPRVIGSADIDGIVLPKAESGADVIQLAHRTGNIPIHAIVTETAASLFGLLSYRDTHSPLVAMSWGAEDLVRGARRRRRNMTPTASSASPTSWRARYASPARSPPGVQPVDGVFADFRDEEGLRAEPARGREGFTGKLAIHPAQVAAINAAFTPSADDLNHAKAIVAAFAADPDAGVLSVGGRMVDRPHLVQARRVWNES